MNQGDRYGYVLKKQAEKKEPGRYHKSGLALMTDDYVEEEKTKIEEMQSDIMVKLRDYLQSLNVLHNMNSDC